jgi:sugar phosphate permease
MAAVPAAEHGEAGGINLTAQLLGGTIGMAVCGTLLAMTGDHRVVFPVAGALAMAVLVIAWFAVERPADGH